MSKLKHGMFAGYVAYRFGSPKPRKPSAILKGIERTTAIDDIAVALRGWQYSPFQHEAACIQGIRSRFCIQGHGWEKANAEAESLVAAALKQIGAARPSWADGQRSTTEISDVCHWCCGPIAEEDLQRRLRYCSTDCATKAVTRRTYKGGREYDTDHRAAKRVLWFKASAFRDCEVCSKPFQNDSTRVRHCSAECAGRIVLSDKNCAYCYDVFRPMASRNKCCSVECDRKLRVKTYRAENPEKQCTECLAIFRPANRQASFCSPRCQGRAGKRRYRQRQSETKTNVIYLTPEHFDREFAGQKSVPHGNAFSAVEAFDRLFG